MRQEEAHCSWEGLMEMQLNQMCHLSLKKMNGMTSASAMYELWRGLTRVGTLAFLFTVTDNSEVDEVAQGKSRQYHSHSTKRETNEYYLVLANSSDLLAVTAHLRFGIQVFLVSTSHHQFGFNMSTDQSKNVNCLPIWWQERHCEGDRLPFYFTVTLSANKDSVSCWGKLHSIAKLLILAIRTTASLSRQQVLASHLFNTIDFKYWL